MRNNQNEVKSLRQVQSGQSPRRTVRKDNLRSQAGKLAEVGSNVADFAIADPLVFWTTHSTKPCLVDLREFAIGRLDRGAVNFSFRGRRPLIEQMAEAVKARHSMSAPKTIDTILTGLRKWWRLFDDIEAEEQEKLPVGAFAKRLTSVLDLGPFHGSRAVQSGMSQNDFHSFVVLANITRLALGQKRPLYWRPPEKRKRGLPIVLAPDDIKALYHCIKADWQMALDRWSLADGIVAKPTHNGFSLGDSPDTKYFRKILQQSIDEGDEIQATWARQRLAKQCDHEHILAAGIGLWRAASTRLGHFDLVRQDLIDSAGTQRVPEGAFNISEVAEALYPNGIDIRSAFYLCQTVGGLNASVLLQLQLDLSGGLDMQENLIGTKADEAVRRQWVLRRCPFLVQSPIDGEYYIEGWKERAKAWISRNYKWKQHLTPGPILVELIIRTWPLRVALSRRLEAASNALNHAIQNNTNFDVLNKLQQVVVELTHAVRSVWIYRGMHFVTWLTTVDHHIVQPSKSYLNLVTCRLNDARRAQGRPEIEPMEARRFRDAYAVWVLDYSGGNVLAVMAALDHRQASTTGLYLDNTIVRVRVAKKYRTFSQALFGSLATGTLDPTLLAMETRHAEMQTDERKQMAIRLLEYRSAVKSRYGVGCRDPHHPSALVDPTFDADGVKFCTTHRCTLCHDNAIITPGAYPGLILRQAELEFREDNTPVESFLLSSFDAELKNVRIALLPFKASDPGRLASTIELHKKEFREGKRKVPGFSVRVQPI